MKLELRPIIDICFHKALFFNSDGQYVGVQKIKYHNPTFSFKDGAYNFLPLECSTFKIGFSFFSTKYYQYIVGDPMPLKISTPILPVINAKAYKSILDSDLVIKLNPKKWDLWAMIGGWKGILILAVAAGLIYWAMHGGVSSGTVTATAQAVRK
jgi:hypothetical protein